MNHRFACLLVAVLALIGCPVGGTGGSGGTGGGGVIGGGEGTPPGNTGEKAPSLAQTPLSSICATRGGVIYLGSNGGKSLYSTDGTNFFVVDGTARDFSSVYCDQTSTTSTAVWFVGPAGTIFYYDGALLSQQVSGITTDLNAVLGTDTSNVYAVGNGGIILNFNGAAWTPQASSVTEDLMGIGSLQRVTEFTVGGGRTVLQVIPPSADWAQVNSLPVSVPVDTQLNAAWADSVSTEVFVVGNAGKILHRTPGLVWEEQASGVSSDLLAVHGISNTGVFATGINGTILFYDGSSWSRVINSPAEGTDIRISGVLVPSAGSAYVVGSYVDKSVPVGVILHLSGGVWSHLL